MKKTLQEITQVFKDEIGELEYQYRDFDTQRLLEITELFYNNYEADLPWHYQIHFFGVMTTPPGTEINYQTNTAEAMLIVSVIYAIYKDDLNNMTSLIQNFLYENL